MCNNGAVLVQKQGINVTASADDLDQDGVKNGAKLAKEQSLNLSIIENVEKSHDQLKVDADSISLEDGYNLIDPKEITRLVNENKGNITKIEEIAWEYIEENLIKPLEKEYHVIFLFSEIDRSYAKRIRAALFSEIKRSEGDEATNTKDILLILRSKGGDLESAYLISKMCGKLKKENFVVAIPAEAKSAATLLALGADSIHMGLLSELGPIDPQIDGYPALSLSTAVDILAKISVKNPGSEILLFKYLESSKLNPVHLGHYDRKTASATQYATRLLQQRNISRGKTSVATDGAVSVEEELGMHFTTHYKDHNFVIDADECSKLFGESVVKLETNIYKISQEVDSFIEKLEARIRMSISREYQVIIAGRKISISQRYIDC